MAAWASRMSRRFSVGAAAGLLQLGLRLGAGVRQGRPLGGGACAGRRYDDLRGLEPEGPPDREAGRAGDAPEHAGIGVVVVRGARGLGRRRRLGRLLEAALQQGRDRVRRLGRVGALRAHGQTLALADAERHQAHHAARVRPLLSRLDAHLRGEATGAGGDRGGGPRVDSVRERDLERAHDLVAGMRCRPNGFTARPLAHDEERIAHGDLAAFGAADDLERLGIGDDDGRDQALRLHAPAGRGRS